jgi:hypothetical protein
MEEELMDGMLTCDAAALIDVCVRDVKLEFVLLVPGRNA